MKGHESKDENKFVGERNMEEETVVVAVDIDTEGIGIGCVSGEEEGWDTRLRILPLRYRSASRVHCCGVQADNGSRASRGGMNHIRAHILHHFHLRECRTGRGRKRHHSEEGPRK